MKQKKLFPNALAKTWFWRHYDLTEDLDRNLAIIGLVIGVILSIWLSSMGKEIAGEASVLLFLACAIYLIARNRLSILTAFLLEPLHAKRRTYLILNILFFALFSYSTISVVLRTDVYSRPLAYFILIAVITAIIAVEIIFFPQDRKAYTGFLLIKIMMIALSLRWIPQLLFPELLGLDPWAHRSFTIRILEMGHIPEDFGYSKLPIMHLIVGSTMLITDLNYKLSTMFSIDFIEVIGIVFVFLLGRFIYNIKVGLMASLLLGVASRNIRWGFWTIPQTLTLTLILIMIYLIFIKERKIIIIASLYLITGVIIILTHTIGSLAVALLLFTFWLSFETLKRVNQEKYSTLNLSLVIMFITTLISYWMYASGHLETLTGFIKWGLKPDYWSESTITKEYFQYKAPYCELFLNRLGFFLFQSFAVIGSFYMLSKKFGNKYSFALVIGSFATMSIAFFSTPLGLTALQADRWYYFLEIIMAIPASVGLFIIPVVFKSNLKKMLTLIILLTTVSFLSITSDIANMDNPIYTKNIGIRFAFMESELKATKTITNIYDGKITSDMLYTTLRQDNDIGESLLTRNFSELKGLIVFRKMVATKPFWTMRSVTKLDYDPYEQLNTFNHIYSSGTVDAFGR